MVSRQVYTTSFLASILCSSVIGLSDAASVSGETAALAVRNPDGTGMSEYFHQGELVKLVKAKPSLLPSLRWVVFLTPHARPILSQLQTHLSAYFTTIQL